LRKYRESPCEQAVALCRQQRRHRAAQRRSSQLQRRHQRIAQPHQPGHAARRALGEPLQQQRHQGVRTALTQLMRLQAQTYAVLMIEALQVPGQ